MMQSNFEWFNPMVGTPMVSFAEYGLGFNRAAIEALGNPAKVRLGFDKESRIIGIMPATEDDLTAVVFASKERNGYVRISSKDFTRFILRYCPDLKLEKALRCLAWFDEVQGALLADLKQTVDSDVDNNSEE